MNTTITAGDKPGYCSSKKQVWVIGRGWVDAEIIEQQEADAAILEAMKGDDQFQNYSDLLP